MGSTQKIDTTRFGSLAFEENQVIRMLGGMLGFPDSRRFVMIPHGDASPFFWYQSLDDPALAFVIVDPKIFLPGYAVDLQAVGRTMSWDQQDAANALTFAVVTIPRSAPEKMTMNLVGPLIVNGRIREAVQTVLPDPGHSHQHRLIPRPQKPMRPNRPSVGAKR